MRGADGLAYNKQKCHNMKCLIRVKMITCMCMTTFEVGVTISGVGGADAGVSVQWGVVQSCQ